MESFLIKAAQLIVALAFLVIIHECGHYIFARIFGIKEVETAPKRPRDRRTSQ